jgi:hypothetical protein
MAKPTKSKAELRDLILSEIAKHPVCPAGMDVVIEAVEGGSWRALSIPPGGGPIAYADCVDYIGQIARRLRVQFDLAPDPPPVRPRTLEAGPGWVPPQPPPTGWIENGTSIIEAAIRQRSLRAAIAGEAITGPPLPIPEPLIERGDEPNRELPKRSTKLGVSGTVQGAGPYAPWSSELPPPLPLRAAANAYGAAAVAAASRRASTQFADGEAVTQWLVRQPADVAQVFAARAALRALPSLAARLRRPESAGQADRERILRVFCCLAASWATAAYPGHRAELQAASQSMVNSIKSAHGIHESAAFMAAASAAASPTSQAVHLAATASTQALDAVGEGGQQSFDAMLRAFEQDAGALATGETILTQGFSPVTVAHQPLWPRDVPDWARENWGELKSTLHTSGEDWEVWTEWYDARLLGSATNQQDDIARAKIEDEIWSQGPKIANAHIKRLLEEKDIFHDATAESPESPIEAPAIEIPDQLPLGSQFAVDASGLIDLVPDPPSLAPLADGLQREMYREVRHKVLGVSALGHNQLGDLSQPVDRFVAALPERLEDASITRLWSRGNTLRRRLKAHETASASNDPTDPARLPTLVAETLSDLVETYNIFIIGDPRGRELDQARLGPQERDEAQAIVQAAVPIAEAIRSSEGVATASAAEALVEQVENAQGAGAGVDADQAVDLSRKTAINFVAALLRVAYVPIRNVIGAGGAEAGFAWKEMRAGTYRCVGPAGLGVAYFYRQEVITFIVENASSLKIFVEQAFHNSALIRIIDLITSAALS